MRYFFILTFALILASPAHVLGQQTGDAFRNYTINGGGSGGTSHVLTTISVPGTFSNVYSTQDPGSPVIWAAAPTGTIGWVNTGLNSVDIGPVGLEFPGFGLDPSSPFHQFFWTDQFGQMNLSLNAPAGLASLSLYFAMAHLTPASPDGFYVSQTHAVTFSLDPNLPAGNATCSGGGTPLNIADDASVQVNLGFSYMFYGISYSVCFVGSNGFVTFGSGDTDFTQSVPEFLANQPRIAMWWDDLNPASGAQGAISFLTDNSANAEVCFSGVPEFSNTGANSFRLTMSSSGLLILDYGAMSSLNAIVGLSPGGNLDPVGTPMNLSVAPNAITPGSAAYELFDGITSSNDLAGFLVQFLMDGVGNPILEL